MIMKNTLDKKYLDICEMILTEGVRKSNRTGVDTIATTGLSIRHNMQEGFPLLTTKKVFHKAMRVELEGFLKGITSKKWYQERDCNIWNDWCNPEKVPYGTDEDTKAKMKMEDDLGVIYGYQWTNFQDPRFSFFERQLLPDEDKKKLKEAGKMGANQLQNIIDTLKNNPNDRRMICSAWNPLALNQMALPPCHILWQVIIVEDRLDLIWYQRSVDVPLGLPFNISSYATLLHLLAKQFGYKEGILTGHFGDIHIYENQIEGIKEQMNREPKDLPQAVTSDDFDSVLTWEHNMTKFENYQSHPTIKFPISV